LKVSQPRKRDTIQIKRVRQVSIVEREVAETVRVTERPKKLKPLCVCVSLVVEKGVGRGSETYPILNMMRILDTQILLYCITSLQASLRSK
jgi:hypothetical protein